METPEVLLLILLTILVFIVRLLRNHHIISFHTAYVLRWILFGILVIGTILIRRPRKR